MTDHAKYWPGGIPSYIQCHPTPIGIAEVPEEVKGWQLFIEENAVPRDVSILDEYFEVNLRRRLVDEWASMTQEARNAYQDRAPVRPDASWYHPHLFRNWRRQIRDSQNSGICNCIVPYPLTPRNCALWTKMRILLYNLEGENSTLYGGDDGDVALLEPSAAGPNPIASAGISFVDQEALDTGRLLLCGIANNGNIIAEGRYWPMFTQSVAERIKGLGKSAREIIEEDIFHIRHTYIPLNMEQPILDILEDTKPAFEGRIDEWMNNIERCAPGYLDMEEENNGMVTNYDHSKLKADEELFAM